MIRLFKKKEKQEQNKVKLGIFLAEALREYEETHKLIVNPQYPFGVEEFRELNKEWKRLHDLGLGNTRNCKEIQSKIDEYEEIMEKQKKAGKLLDFMSLLKTGFRHSFLISKEKFVELLEKYNLRVGLLEEYTGVIPERNIKEITWVSTDLKYIKTDKINNNLFYATGIIDNSIGNEKNEAWVSSLRKFMKKNGNLIPIFHAPFPDKIHSKDVDLDLGVNPQWSFLIEVLGKRLDKTTLLIAAPKEYLNTKEVPVIKNTPVDPIVFQSCPYGVIIHSVWGEEAEDKILEEYKKLKDLV